MSTETAPASASKWSLAARSNDILASLVVFLVALPLCMGIAIASGAPPALGLITGIVGGLVVGSLAGSPLQVSGPAAGMAVLVLELIQDYGLAMLGVVGLIAGSVQLVAGIFKLGQWFRAISPSVIHGMLAGIGVLILTSQFHVMLDASPPGKGLANVFGIPRSMMDAVVPMVGDTHHIAAGVGILTILTIIAWNRFKPAALAAIPAPLLAVVVGSAAAALLQLPIARVDVPANIADSLNMPTAAALAQALTDPNILILGLAFAFVASAETLLCATAVDQMHTGPRTRYNQELRAQGVGNLICGAVGALPMTGVIVRSSANVAAGATTRLSAILHGVWLLATVAALPWLLSNIPMSVLAAILVYTGYKLINLAQIRKIAQFGRMELAIYFATLLGIVAVDLLTGVLIGLVLALVKIVYTFSYLGVDHSRDADAKRTDLTLCGAATFLSIPKLSEALEAIPAGDEVHVHVQKLDHIDHASLDLLAAWERQHEATGGTLVMEWDELIHRYAIRSDTPAQIKIGSGNTRKPQADLEGLQSAE